jgi:hypothetical protein
VRDRDGRADVRNMAVTRAFASTEDNENKQTHESASRTFYARPPARDGTLAAARVLLDARTLRECIFTPSRCALAGASDAPTSRLCHTGVPDTLPGIRESDAGTTMSGRMGVYGTSGVDAMRPTVVAGVQENEWPFQVESPGWRAAEKAGARENQ